MRRGPGAALPPVALLARWDGFCLPCGSEQRPLVLTWQGRRGVGAWLAGEGFPDGVLRLTCGCCGGVDVVGWEPEPEPSPLDDAGCPPVHLGEAPADPARPAVQPAGVPAPRSTGDVDVADVMAELAALQETPTGPPHEAQEPEAQQVEVLRAEAEQAELAALLGSEAYDVLPVGDAPLVAPPAEVAPRPPVQVGPWFGAETPELVPEPRPAGPQAALPAVPDLVPVPAAVAAEPVPDPVPDVVPALVPARVPAVVPRAARLPLPGGVFAAHAAVPPARWEPAPEPLSRLVDAGVPLVVTVPVDADVPLRSAVPLPADEQELFALHHARSASPLAPDLQVLAAVRRTADRLAEGRAASAPEAALADLLRQGGDQPGQTARVGRAERRAAERAARRGRPGAGTVPAPRTGTDALDRLHLVG